MGYGSECRTETVWASCLSNALRLSSRWLKRAPQREGQVSASGLAVDHSKDDTMSSSQTGSGLVSNLRIIAGAAVTPLYLSSAFFGEASTSARRARSSLRCCSFIPFPSTRSCSPLEPLQMLVESWEINARNLVLDNLEVVSAELFIRQERQWPMPSLRCTTDEEYQGFTISQP